MENPQQRVTQFIEIFVY